MKYLPLLLIPFLASCSMLEKRSVEVVKQEIAIPPTLLQPCLPEAPIDQDSYAKLTSHEREIELGLYTIHLYEVIASCNVKITTVKKIVEQFDAMQAANKEDRHEGQ
jgi:hypothetical protein